MKSSIKLGRDNSNDFIITEPRISRVHAILSILSDGHYEIKDLGSTNGTYVNGRRITRQIIKPGDKIKLASTVIDWESLVRKNSGDQLVSEEPASRVERSIGIGSANDNDIILNNQYVSSHHASISLLKNQTFYLRDLDSRNGSFVNGIRVRAKQITKDDVIKIGRFALPAGWHSLFSKEKLQNSSIKTFALPVMGGLTFVDVDKIIYCEGASNQTMVYLETGKKELITKTLKDCHDLLPQITFLRIHKSYLVNLSYIKKYITGKDGQVILSNGKALPVSRNYKEDFLNKFRKH